MILFSSCSHLKFFLCSNVLLWVYPLDPAKIKRTSSSGIVYPPGVEAKLFCEVDGSPIGDEYVTWQKVGSNHELPGRYSTSFVNRTSYLHIEHPSHEDVGEYRCKVNNGIGNVTSDPILFITNCTYYVWIPIITIIRSFDNPRLKRRI